MATEIPWPYPDDGAISFVRRYLSKIDSRESYFWAIVLKENPDLGLIGVIGLTPDSDDDHRGFWLGQDYWGKGYMREVAATVTDFAFEDLGMTELLLGNALPNIASHKLKESSGAEIIEIDPEGSYIGGRFPKVKWRLTAEAWKQH